MGLRSEELVGRQTSQSFILSEENPGKVGKEPEISTHMDTTIKPATKRILTAYYRK